MRPTCGWPEKFGATSFQDFQQCGPDPPTSQTDGRHAIAMPRFAVCTKVHGA